MVCGRVASVELSPRAMSHETAIYAASTLFKPFINSKGSNREVRRYADEESSATTADSENAGICMHRV